MLQLLLVVHYSVIVIFRGMSIVPNNAPLSQQWWMKRSRETQEFIRADPAFSSQLSLSLHLCIEKRTLQPYCICICVHLFSQHRARLEASNGCRTVVPHLHLLCLVVQGRIQIISSKKERKDGTSPNLRGYSHSMDKNSYYSFYSEKNAVTIVVSKTFRRDQSWRERSKG